MRALHAGSYLALSHGSADFRPPGTASHAAIYEAAAPLVLRTHAQITGFFEVFDLAGPGLVQALLWRPEGKPPRAKDLVKIGMDAGVGINKG